jgi:hypothetical protein
MKIMKLNGMNLESVIDDDTEEDKSWRDHPISMSQYEKFTF